MKNENPFSEKIQTSLERERIFRRYVTPGAHISCESQGLDESSLDVLNEEIMPLDEEDVSLSGMQEGGDILIFCKTKNKLTREISKHVFAAQSNGAFKELDNKSGFSFPLIGLASHYFDQIITVEKPTEATTS